MALVTLGVFSACSDAAAGRDVPSPALRELRGVWIATVDNIDWPSLPGLPGASLRQELDALLDLGKDARGTLAEGRARMLRDTGNVVTWFTSFIETHGR